MIDRWKYHEIVRKLEQLPAVALLGCRQVGKTTLALEIAGKLGVSLERVRQIQVRAITKMNTPTLRKAIDPFLV